MGYASNIRHLQNLASEFMGDFSSRFRKAHNRHEGIEISDSDILDAIDSVAFPEVDGETPTEFQDPNKLLESTTPLVTYTMRTIKSIWKSGCHCTEGIDPTQATLTNKACKLIADAKAALPGDDDGPDLSDPCRSIKEWIANELAFE